MGRHTKACETEPIGQVLGTIWLRNWLNYVNMTKNDYSAYTVILNVQEVNIKFKKIF